MALKCFSQRSLRLHTIPRGGILWRAWNFRNIVCQDPEIKPSLSDSDKTKYTAVFKPLSANYNEIQIELPVSVKAKPVPTPTAPPTATPVATPGSTPGSVPSSAPATVPPSLITSSIV